MVRLSTSRRGGRALILLPLLCLTLVSTSTTTASPRPPEIQKQRRRLRKHKQEVIHIASNPKRYRKGPPHTKHATKYKGPPAIKGYKTSPEVVYVEFNEEEGIATVVDGEDESTSLPTLHPTFDDHTNGGSTKYIKGEKGPKLTKGTGTSKSKYHYYDKIVSKKTSSQKHNRDTVHKAVKISKSYSKSKSRGSCSKSKSKSKKKSKGKLAAHADDDYYYHQPDEDCSSSSKSQTGDDEDGKFINVYYTNIIYVLIGVHGKVPNKLLFFCLFSFFSQLL